MTITQTPVPADSYVPPSRPAPGNTPAIEIVVYGTPAPQGSKKAFARKSCGVYTGQVSMQESSKKVKPWRDAVHATALAIRPAGWVTLDGPLAASMVFTLKKPQRERLTTWHVRYPDLSKLIRSTEDALTTAGIWADDARVVEYRAAAKVYPGGDHLDALDQPGAVIRVWRIGGAA